MDVEVIHLVQIECGKVGMIIGQHVAFGFESGLAKMDSLGEKGRIAPAEIVIPGLQGDIAIHGPPISQSRRPRSPDIVENLMIVKNEKRWHVAVPFGQGFATRQVELVVLPNADNRGGHLDHLWDLVVGSMSNLLEPLLERVVAHFLIKPITV